MSGISCGNCKAKHDTVAQVRACYGQPARVVIDYPISVPAPVAEVAPSAPAIPDFVQYPASEKQVAFIQRLADERDWSLAGGEQSDTIMNVLDGKSISKKEASTAITFLQGCVKSGKPLVAAAASANGAVTEIGMYRKGDKFFRVYPARNGGHLLAKELVGEADYDEPNDIVWSFVYRGTPRSAGLTAGDRMTLEEAKAFGAQFGVCCVCAALLTDPTSVAAGIGPICGSRV